VVGVLTRRALLSLPAAFSCLAALSAVAGPARSRVLAVPDGGTALAPAAPGWTIAPMSDPIAAVVAGTADAAWDGHAHWADAPPALAFFGGLPGGLSPTARDGWLATAGGRDLWTALHARVGLRALVIDGGPALRLCADRPLRHLADGEGARIAAPVPLGRLLRGIGFACATTLDHPGTVLRLPDAGPPLALVVRTSDRDRSAPDVRVFCTDDDAEDLALEWRIALANAAADWLDGLASTGDALDRAVVVAFTATIGTVSAKSNLT
jgi:hypothetical protein